jgi:hypothetical protein
MSLSFRHSSRADRLRLSFTPDALQMKIAIVFGAIALMLAATAVLRARVAEHGTYADVPKHLTGLKGNTDPTAFFGFCTRDEDALYFVWANYTFNLDYELYNAQKEKYAEPFRKAASDLRFKVVETTYDNRHVVLRIRLSSAEHEAAEQAFQFAHRLFGLQRTTELEFLP